MIVLTLVSVVIPNLNGKRYLHDCLSSLALQTFQDFEVIVVDNGSCDGSINYLRSNFPWVKILAKKENLGFGAGTNCGIKAARGDLILTLNNDTEANRNFIEFLIKPMSDKSVGMCASKMLFLDGKINSTGICISRSGAAWDRGMLESDRGQYDFQEEVFGPCAGAGLYRKEMLKEIGLFDEDFFLYMEDVDLAFRGRLAGWKCIYVPNATVYHHHGGTASFGSDLAVYYVNRNVIWYPIKDFPTVLLVTSLPFIIGRNLAVIPYYIIRGKGKIILQSKLDALAGIPKMLCKRHDVIRQVSLQESCRWINTWCGLKKR